MAEIGFYHLTRSTPEAAIAPLLARTLAAGERAAVLSAAGRVPGLDAALWEADWLPHGTAGGAYETRQPIWLSGGALDGDPPNAARFLFLIDGRTTPALDRFARVFDLFDGRDAVAVEAARARWRDARVAAHTLVYWQQAARGWERRTP